MNRTFTPLGRKSVLVFLFLATTINYIDRQTLSVLAPVLQHELKLSSLEYSYVVNSFLIVYSVFYVLSGTFVDKLGTRRGVGFAVILWSAAEMLHAAVGGLISLCAVRALLAVGEAAILPGGMKAVAEWFKPRDRGLAVGLFETGLSVGPIITPPLVAWISLHQNWRYAFLWTGIMGLLWAIPWLLVYHKPEIEPDRAAKVVPPRVPWSALMLSRPLIAVGLGRLFGDPVWYFYLFWLPKYLADARGLSVQSIGAVAWIPFLAALLGGLTGGTLSSRLIRAGMPAVQARETVLLGSSLIVSVGVVSVFASDLVWAILAMSIGAFAMQCWGSNLDTLPTDLFPSHQVARAVGFCGLFGSVGGIAFTAATGYVVQHYSYTPVWIITGLMYPIGYLMLRSLLSGGRKRPNRSSTNRFLPAN